MSTRKTTTKSPAPTAAKPTSAAAKTTKAAKTTRAAAPARPARPRSRPAAKAAPVAAKPEAAKPAKAKLVRDSFTMPQADFALVAALKARALDFKRPTKKSELLRAGLHALAALDDARLQQVLEALAPLKPGRPKKGA